MKFTNQESAPRSHAGEGIEDGANVPGIVLCALGVVALGAALTAAGYGFAGWALVAGIVCALCAVGGACWLIAERYRKQRRHSLPPQEYRQGH